MRKLVISCDCCYKVIEQDPILTSCEIKEYSICIKELPDTMPVVPAEFKSIALTKSLCKECYKNMILEMSEFFKERKYFVTF